MLTQTFMVSTNDTLTAEFSGVFNLEHFTDQSDNPQDFHFYVGSLGSAGDVDDRLLQAASDPGVDNITVSVVVILPVWTVATAKSLGDCVYPTVSNGYRYRCTTAGTTHASVQPTWPTTIGNTVADGTAVWTCVSAKHPTTEVVLALTEAELDTNTPGVALSLGNTITSSTTEAVDVWVRFNNAVLTSSNNVATPEYALKFNQLIEIENI